MSRRFKYELGLMHDYGLEENSGCRSSPYMSHGLELFPSLSSRKRSDYPRHQSNDQSSNPRFHTHDCFKPFFILGSQKKNDLIKLKLERVYSPIYYMLYQARERVVQLNQSDNARLPENGFTLTYAEIDDIERILRDNAHLISQEMINLWLQRNQGAIFTQWNRQQGSTGLFDVVTGLTCSLADFFNMVNSEFQNLRKKFGE